MFNTLFRRLVAVLLLFGLLMSLIFMMIMRYSHSTYHQEVEQKVNAGVAERFATLAGWTPSGWKDPDAAAAAFSTVVNLYPQFNVFILDRDGQVLAHYPESARLVSSRVALQPIMRMLQPDPPFPLLGDDPARSAKPEVFSVARLNGADRPEQYLYVTLHSEEHHESAERLRFSYVTREGAWLIGASLALALAGGLLSLHFIVRPIQRLARAMDRFRENPHADAVQVAQEAAASGDEIDRLTQAFYRMAEQIHAQLQVIEQEDASRREFFANISHDLRTPLASIQGYLDTLLLKNESLAPENRRQYLQIAVRQAQSLNELVGTLFYLAKLDSGQIELQPEVFRIDELVQDVLQKFALDAENKAIRLDAEVSGKLPFVYADLGLIERALSNLMDNALQHTPAGGSITVRLESRAGKVWVAVEDSGTGIADADLPHVFERFYRGTDSRSEAPANAGLGLSIVRRIVNMHGQTISAANAGSQGALFRFSLHPLENNQSPSTRESFSAAI